jgi:hypothetical protein
MSSSP